MKFLPAHLTHWIDLCCCGELKIVANFQQQPLWNRVHQLTQTNPTPPKQRPHRLKKKPWRIHHRQHGTTTRRKPRPPPLLFLPLLKARRRTTRRSFCSRPLLLRPPTTTTTTNARRRRSSSRRTTAGPATTLISGRAPARCSSCWPEWPPACASPFGAWPGPRPPPRPLHHPWQQQQVRPCVYG